jgi:hypothetical protein
MDLREEFPLLVGGRQLEESYYGVQQGIWAAVFDLHTRQEIRGRGASYAESSRCAYVLPLRSDSPEIVASGPLSIQWMVSVSVVDALTPPPLPFTVML